MTDKPSILLAGSAACERAAMSKWPGAKVLGSFRDLTLVEFVLSNLPVDVVAVESGLATRGESFSDWIARFRLAFPAVSLVVMEPSWDRPEKETHPGSAEGAPPSVLSPQTVVIWSPKGGVGKTFLATNFACAASLSTAGQVCLLDLDLYSGDVAVQLDLADGPTITDMVPALAEIRPEGLERFVCRHAPSGLNVICSPRRPELSELVTQEHVKSILSLASRHWGLLYVDTPPDITSDVVGACIDAATSIVLVVTQDVAALRRCKLALDILRKLGVRDEALAIVLNRSSKDSLMPQARIQEFLGLDLAGSIPEDRRVAERSIFEAKPVVLQAKSEIGEAVWQAVSRICPGLVQGKQAKRPEKRKGGLFR